MAKKGGFPPPEEISFMLMDRDKGEAVPVDSLSTEEWQRLRGKILWNIGRRLSDLAAQGEEF